ncbi:MAG: HlyD family efflux transporter periplasmic adaptor subunit [Phycisphaerae bacterium]|nr:HlyD family efflux transporter periplasmic adaptor subunit [Phycisphaerae bacterium]
MFVSGVYATVLLWDMHLDLPNGIGAVKALRIDIVSPVDGVLVNLPGDQLDLFDTVGDRKILCRFDDRPVQAMIATLAAEVTRLKKELAATDAQMQLDFAERSADKSDRRQTLLDDARRLAVDLERMKLDVADRTIELESNRIGLKRRAEKLAIVKDLVKRKLETPYVLSDTQLRHDVVEREILEQEKALVEAKALEVKAQVRMDNYSKMVREEDVLREANAAKDGSKDAAEPLAESIRKRIAVFLAPIEAAAAVQEARIQEAVLQRAALEIPVPPEFAETGRIVEVFRRPGQAVRAGEPIMRIANPGSMYIVSYVRQPHRVVLEPNTVVGVQVRSIPIREATTRIAKIGPQIESIPARQLRDPTKPEWGLPVKIRVPDELKLTPGELVNITYKPN